MKKVNQILAVAAVLGAMGMEAPPMERKPQTFPSTIPGTERKRRTKAKKAALKQRKQNRH